MNKLLSLTVAAALGIIGASAAAQTVSPPAEGTAMPKHAAMKDGKGVKMMDANSDGMVSKDEFMKHHEAVFDKMKKNSSGSVDMKDVDATTGGPMMQR